MSTTRVLGFSRWTVLLVAAAVVGMGTVALAAETGGTVSVSSVHSPAYLPEYALDGKLDTRWASRADVTAPEWLQIDLGKVVPIEFVTIHWEVAHATEYQLQVSEDGKKWATLAEKKGGRGGKETFADLSGRGRYFRVYCTKPSSHKLYSIWEVEFPDPEVARAVVEAQRKAAEERLKAEAEALRGLADVLGRYNVEEIVFAVRQRGKDGHWYANFSHYSYDENIPLYGNGGKLCRKNLKTGVVTVLLDDPEGGVRDPVVDYDAQKIVFSYRKGGTENYHLHEIGVDGTGLRELTSGPFDDFEPAFLPDGDLVFVSSRCKRYVQCWLTKVAVLYRCDRDGRNMRPISANLEHDNTPWPLPDGRILYQRWEYVDRSQVDYHHLWTTNPDGTSQMVYYGNMHPGIVMIDAKPIPGTRKVLSIFSPGHGANEHDGVLTIVDPRGGPDDRAFATQINAPGSYRDPWAFSEDTFMAVSGRKIVMIDADGQTVTIHQTSEEEARANLELHEPRPVMVRPREQIIPSRVDHQAATGRLVVMNVYQGRNMTGVKHGEIKKLLVVESLPKPINFTGGMDPLTYGGSFTLERVLGTVPVDEDGSAHMELPAMRSLFLIALDENNLAVKRMQSFLSVQPGETSSCVGCHEQRTQTFVPNRS
ncbi:MAG: discoidin domain-containing protein, partial [Planctomycetes bacterium]|nr:discoidin domain-containing protein [Planctomycetota bacterium]